MDPIVVVDTFGTGHLTTCPDAPVPTPPEAVRKFSTGGFDMFCRHDCLADMIQRRTHPRIPGDPEPVRTPGPHPSTPTTPTPEVDDVESYVRDHPDKFTPGEVTPQLKAAAEAWLAAIPEETLVAQARRGFGYLYDLRQSDRRTLTPGQAKGVLNCWRAELRKAAKAPAQADTGLDLSPLPAATYAVPGGNTRLKVAVRRPGQRSKWHGWTFVDDGAEYGSRRNYGRQAPDGLYQGDIADQLAAILADPEAALARYGQLTGTCGVCSRTLEDADSVARGIGPVCARKLGID